MMILKPIFTIGKTVGTAAVMARAEDKEALANRSRILSLVRVDEQKFHIISEADRSQTTAMFADEYSKPPHN
jgi:hypothetical protein